MATCKQQIRLFSHLSLWFPPMSTCLSSFVTGLYGSSLFMFAFAVRLRKPRVWPSVFVWAVKSAHQSSKKTSRINDFTSRERILPPACSETGSSAPRSNVLHDSAATPSFSHSSPRLRLPGRGEANTQLGNTISIIASLIVNPFHSVK